MKIIARVFVCNYIFKRCVNFRFHTKESKCVFNAQNQNTNAVIFLLLQESGGIEEEDSTTRTCKR
jgi:hypothetical protein